MARSFVSAPFASPASMDCGRSPVSSFAPPGPLGSIGLLRLGEHLSGRVGAQGPLERRVGWASEVVSGLEERLATWMR